MGLIGLALLALCFAIGYSRDERSWLAPGAIGAISYVGWIVLNIGVFVHVTLGTVLYYLLAKCSLVLCRIWARPCGERDRRVVEEARRASDRSAPMSSGRYQPKYPVSISAL